MEIETDEEVSNIIARRQPAARDLRLLMATSKCVTNLERAGDEARKIAKRTRRIATQANARIINIAEIKVSGEMALHILRRALDAFALPPSVLDATARAWRNPMARWGKTGCDPRCCHVRVRNYCRRSRGLRW
jgi:phosphate transport system protein